MQALRIGNCHHPHKIQKAGSGASTTNSHVFSQKQATNLLYSGGLKVYTTQDSKIQNILDEEYADPSNYPAPYYWPETAKLKKIKGKSMK